MERSHAQRLAREAFVLNLARTVVVNKETKDFENLISDYNQLVVTGSCEEAEKRLDQIVTEKARLQPRGHWDEEEVAIALIEKRNGKK